jgi:TonB family protein
LRIAVAAAGSLVCSGVCRGAWVPTEIPGVSYPRIARAAAVAGPVVVEFQINPDGTVKEATAVSGPSILRVAAVQAARQWRFKPSQANEPAFRATFDFRLEGTCTTQCCSERLVFRYPDGVSVTAEILGVQPSVAGR